MNQPQQREDLSHPHEGSSVFLPHRFPGGTVPCSPAGQQLWGEGPGSHPCLCRASHSQGCHSSQRGCVGWAIWSHRGRYQTPIGAAFSRTQPFPSPLPALAISWCQLVVSQLSPRSWSTGQLKPRPRLKLCGRHPSAPGRQLHPAHPKRRSPEPCAFNYRCYLQMWPPPPLKALKEGVGETFSRFPKPQNGSGGKGPQSSSHSNPPAAIRDTFHKTRILHTLSMNTSRDEANSSLP